MNIQQLERSQKMYTNIKELDAEIIEIEKIAMLLVDGNAEVKLNLSVKDTTPKSEKIAIDEDGDMKATKSGPLTFGIMSPMAFMQRIQGSRGLWIDDDPLQAKQDNSEKMSYGISENLSLNVLAILLNEKLEKRAKLIKSLNRIGVTI